MSKVLRIIDQVAAALILLTGRRPRGGRLQGVHRSDGGAGLVPVGRADGDHLRPGEPGPGASERPSRLLALAGLSGSLGMVLMGALLHLAPARRRSAPASGVVFAVGLHRRRLRPP